VYVRLSRLSVAALIVALVAFTFADGLHSVHHLPDHKAASRCALAAASTNVVGCISDVIPIALPPLSRLVVLEEREPARTPLEPIWTTRGRAPPLSPS